jgi:hypothetical protein
MMRRNVMAAVIAGAAVLGLMAGGVVSAAEYAGRPVTENELNTQQGRDYKIALYNAQEGNPTGSTPDAETTANNQ